MASSLRYQIRIRDLVHGFVHLTELEEKIIDHPLFQRLRHIRQNDVACYVYPSLNTSRFEHSLGVAHVAGRMAENLTLGKNWKNYQKDLEDKSPENFVQICRVYGLLHDVGHLPLSHLFEMAFEDYAHGSSPNEPLSKVTKKWFSDGGFTKLHEAAGAKIASKILNDTKIKAPDVIKKEALLLLGSKKIAPENPIRVIKLLIDSEIDADRIDSTARDGILAGGEYGNYDIERLCTSTHICKEDGKWVLAYSSKSLNSIESLLLDRYRIHNWVHFHHRVVALKAATSLLIGYLLKKKKITKDSFPITKCEEMLFRDDVWLWNLLRSEAVDQNDADVMRSRDALFERKKSGIILLWKNRTQYQKYHQQLEKKLTLRKELPTPQKFGRAYEKFLSNKISLKSLVFWLPFQPHGQAKIRLIQEHGNGTEFEDDALNSSPLLRSLKDVWEKEPNYYIIIFGKANSDRDKLKEKCLEATKEWIESK